MNVSIIYGTLSGSTMTAADTVKDVLIAAGHSVEASPVDQVTKDSLQKSDVIIFGSPSWEDNGKDGQPLPEVTAFLNTLTNVDLQNKKVAVFGLGDTMYPHFCGAVDVMTEKLKDLGVTLVTDPIRIDRYYSLPDNEQKMKDWAIQLSKVFT